MGTERGDQIVLEIAFISTNTLTFVSCEYDRVRRSAQKLESQQLLNGYTGHVLDAKCTVQTDGDFIRGEIEASGGYEGVDKAVHILINAGMSTFDLQEAADEGVNIRGATHSKYSKLVSTWGHWLLYSLATGFHRRRASYVIPVWRKVISVITFMQALLFGVILATFPRDRRRFATDSAAKFVWFGFVIPWIFFNHGLRLILLEIWPQSHNFLHFDNVKNVNVIDAMKMVILFFVSSLTTLASGLGPGGLVHMPYIGKTLVRMVFARSLRECCQIPCARTDPGINLDIELTPMGGADAAAAAASASVMADDGDDPIHAPTGDLKPQVSFSW